LATTGGGSGGSNRQTAILPSPLTGISRKRNPLRRGNASQEATTASTRSSLGFPRRL
jgi:hypothetical protein